MKKMLLSIMVAMVAVCAQAQVYVGGGLGLGSIKYDDGRNSDDALVYKLLPEIGYNIDKNFAAGIVFGWQGTTEGGQKAVSVNPYLRYTFANFKMVSLFVDGSVGYEHRYGGTEHTDAFSVGFKPGIAVALNNKLSFVAHVGFLGYEKIKEKDTKRSLESFGLDLDGNALSFGLYYSF